jgi:hypothetical protein
MFAAAGIFYRVPPMWRWFAGMLITFFGIGWNFGTVIYQLLGLI